MGQVLKLEHQYDFVVIGAGLTGIAAAVTAARNGMRTALINDRPVLGGNASKEFQTPPVGAHAVDRNFAYPRETGILEEILLENLRTNPQGSIELWDINLRGLVRQEENLEVFLNTTVNEVMMSEDRKSIVSVKGYTIDSETWHTFRAPYFLDCTGNGTVGFLAGAPYRRGCEARSEFNERLAAERQEDREMGCSIRFRARDLGRPVSFRAPSWVKYSFTREDFEKRSVETGFKRSQGGFWWIEWGGSLDTVHETKIIQNELLEIIYGIWDYLKNKSSIKDEITNFDLDWVGAMPGKRENRRLEGDHILAQGDIEEQRAFADSVAYGGWGFDDHPPEGIFNTSKASTHYFHKGPFHIPLRCLYSKAVENLFLAGRNISATHLALTSTRVMGTCAQMGEAVGAAVAVCRQYGVKPRGLVETGRVKEVQRLLQRMDHTIIGLPYGDEEDMAPEAQVSASSALQSPVLEQTACVLPMDTDRAWMFPVVTGAVGRIEVLLDCTESTALEYNFYAGSTKVSSLPDQLLYGNTVHVDKGEGQWVDLPLELPVTRPGWYFAEIKKNEKLRVHTGNFAPVGIRALFRREGSPDSNVHTEKENLDWNVPGSLKDVSAYCIRIKPEQPVYGVQNIINPWNRPVFLPNLWISAPTDFRNLEWVHLKWEQQREINSVELIFDSSLDYMLSAFRADGNCELNGYDFNVIPSLVKDYRVLVKSDGPGDWKEVAAVRGNYQRLRIHKFEPVLASELKVEIWATNGINRAQIYCIRVY